MKSKGKLYGNFEFLGADADGIAEASIKGNKNSESRLETKRWLQKGTVWIQILLNSDGKPITQKLKPEAEKI